ncbi:MAG: hypothetical protein KGO96_07690 [Elusimicrobia bacterium]|nr:hypothetical protein [Elusimicrobiota bacterium]
MPNQIQINEEILLKVAEKEPSLQEALAVIRRSHPEEARAISSHLFKDHRNPYYG